MNNIRLLLVEDDPLLGEALFEALSKKGYQTLLAPCGADALAACSDGSFDLVLQDVRLPDADGLDIRCWPPPAATKHGLPRFWRLA